MLSNWVNVRKKILFVLNAETFCFEWPWGRDIGTIQKEYKHGTYLAL